MLSTPTPAILTFSTSTVLPTLTLLFQIDTTPYGDGANSVAVHEGIVAVAVQADPAQAPGAAVFFNTDGEFLSAVTVGALPDMLTFTPNGQYVLVANEGQPDQYCLTDDAGGPRRFRQRY